MARSGSPFARPVSRRPVLVGLAATALIPALDGPLAACGKRPPDPLTGLIIQARSDAALCDAAAQALRTPPGPAATRVDTLTAAATARRAHAEAMAAELGDDAPPPPPADQPAPPAPEARTALTSVQAALDDAQRRAAAEVPGLPRRRAALVGSVAACCAAYQSVLTASEPS